MRTSSAYPLWRRIAAAGSLGVPALGLVAFAVHEAPWDGLNWGVLVLAAMTGAAAVGVTRTGVPAQVLARGAAWVILAPTLLLTVAMVVTGQRPDAAPAAYALASAAALLLARPALHTPAARRDFAPAAMRRSFLAGAVAAAAMGLSLGLGAVEMLAWHAHRGAVLAGVLSASLLASSVGVARMRSWGVLLAGATSFVALLAGLVGAAPGAIVLGLAAVPGIALALALVAARLRALDAPARGAETLALAHAPRVTAAASLAEDPSRAPSPRVRLAVDPPVAAAVDEPDLGRAARGQSSR